MTSEGRATAFVTEAAGFIGTELVKRLVARGHHVIGLAASAEAAERIRRAGATAVLGDPLVPGRWLDEAAADWVFHLPSYSLDGDRLSHRRAAWIARARTTIDRHLLDSVGAGGTKRVVYVGDASCYGTTTEREITEDAPLQPSAWGRCFMPALDRIDGYVAAGLPMITALPAWVYGNGSWFLKRVIEPVGAERRVLKFGTPGPWVSPIHVRDCARALIHLADHGEAGGRYFLVNREPSRLHEFAETFARLAIRPLRTWHIPALAAPLIAGPILAEHVRSNGVFSNIRLRGIGFRFEYPTLEQGLQQVVETLHE
jgi:nucleoside-diphosphate-sugar epimerase